MAVLVASFQPREKRALPASRNNANGNLCPFGRSITFPSKPVLAPGDRAIYRPCSTAAFSRGPVCSIHNSPTRDENTNASMQ